MIAQETFIHADIVERFAKLEEAGSLAHAYLFIGPACIGKSQTALAIAKLLNCEERNESYCDKCSACVKINSGNHPDIHITRVEQGEAIKIENIRLILEQIRLRAFSAKTKVFIVENVENLTIEAANAFLKTLEEPTANSILILTTSVEEKILDTIRSRCHSVYFLPTPQAVLEQKLRTQFNDKTAKSHFLAYFAQGCLGKATQLNDEKFFEVKNKYLDQFIFSAQSDAFVKNLLTDKVKTRQFLDVILSWIRDAMLIKCEVNDQRVIHLDRRLELENFSEKFLFEELNEMYEQVIETLKLLSENLNIKMSLLILKEKIWAN